MGAQKLTGLFSCKSVRRLTIPRSSQELIICCIAGCVCLGDSGRDTFGEWARSLEKETNFSCPSTAAADGLSVLMISFPFASLGAPNASREGVRVKGTKGAGRSTSSSTDVCVAMVFPNTSKMSSSFTLMHLSVRPSTTDSLTLDMSWVVLLFLSLAAIISSAFASLTFELFRRLRCGDVDGLRSRL